MGVPAPRMVMIARDNDGRDAGADELAEEVEYDALRVGRGHRRVIDIAGDEDTVDLPVAGDIKDLLEGSGVLVVAGPVSEVLSDVPVGRVEEAHLVES